MNTLENPRAIRGYGILMNGSTITQLDQPLS